MKRNYSKLLFFTLIAVFPFAGFAQTWENVGSVTGISASWSSNNNLAKDPDGNLYVSYYDGSVSKGSVQKFDGTNWTYVGGSPGITTGSATFNSLAVKDAQNIFYSNQDGYPNTGMNVRKFNGTSWTSLPNPESGAMNHQSIAVDESGIVYAAYGTATGTVKRNINGVWEQLGKTGFASGVPSFIKLKTGTNGKIYAAFVNNGNVHVYENDLTAPSTQAWTAVGGLANIAPAANSENYNCSLAIDANNHLYLAYVSGSTGGNKLNVKKFEGTTWATLGSENFSAGRVQHISIAVTPSGVPYVACSNWENDNLLKNYVYGFNNEAWVQLGGYISSGQATYNALIVDNNDDLILAFSDSGVEKMVVKKLDIVTPISKYCDITFPQNTEPITQLTFAGITNSSSAVVSSSNSYEDFTTVLGNVELGKTYPISVSGYNDNNTIDNFANHIVAYFDWNHDGDFLDANEVYYLGYMQGDASIATLTGSIDVPANALAGNTRMRIIKKYYSRTSQSIADPCNLTGYGQAEDYTIVVSKQGQTLVADVAVSVLNNAAASITTLGGTLQLAATVTPSNSNQNVIWTISSGSDFAAISQDGLVTATADGNVIVKVTSAENTALFEEITIAISNQTVPATCNFAALKLTGFNADIVADGTGGNTDTKTSSIIDAANVLYSKDFVPSNPHSSSASASSFGGGLPVNGTLNSSSTQGLQFQFENYSANNALILRNSLTNTGTLALVTPKKASKIYVASVSAEGANTVTITVNFADNTTQSFTLNATDWWQNSATSNSVITGIGRVSRGASWAPLNQFGGLSETGIYQNEFVLDSGNDQKTINSLTFTQTPPSGNATTTTVLGVSICETPILNMYGPVVITAGFNQDIIANGIGNASQSTTVGFDQANTRALVSLDFKAVSTNTAANFGLPVNGTIKSVATTGITYQLANYTGSNALFLTPSHVGNNAPNNGTLAFSASNVGKLYVLTAAAGGGSTNLGFTATVNFSDGTTQIINNLTISDWYEGTNYAIQGIGRVNTANNNLEGDSSNPKLYEVLLNISKANQNKTITGVNFNFSGDATAEYASQIRMSVLAITTQEASQNVLTVLTSSNAPSTITSDQGTLQLAASLNNQSVSSNITWSIVSGEAYSSIDQQGKVTAIGNGIATVRVTLDSDKSVFAEIDITISNQVLKYCEAYFINGCEDLSISNVTTTGAENNIINASSGCTGSNNLNGYSDHTTKILTASKNSKVTFTINFNGSMKAFAYLSVWIDWNQDFVFDDSERVYLSQNEETSGTLQFTTTIPSDAVSGQTRMRLKAVSGWAGSGACGYNSQGEVEDYTVNIVDENLGTDDFNKTNYTIYPNPTSGLVTIQSSVTVKEVTVFNLIGQQVSKTNTTEINLSNAGQGVYIVQIVFENGTTAIHKIVKN